MKTIYNHCNQIYQPWFIWFYEIILILRFTEKLVINNPANVDLISGFAWNQMKNTKTFAYSVATFDCHRSFILAFINGAHW